MAVAVVRSVARIEALIRIRIQIQRKGQRIEGAKGRQEEEETSPC